NQRVAREIIAARRSAASIRNSSHIIITQIIRVDLIAVLPPLQLPALEGKPSFIKREISFRVFSPKCELANIGKKGTLLSNDHAVLGARGDCGRAQHCKTKKIDASNP